MQTEATKGSLAKFIWVAVSFFAQTLTQGIVINREPIRTFIEAGPGSLIGMAKTHIGLMSWMSLALMAANYYFVPIFSGKPMIKPKLLER